MLFQVCKAMSRSRNYGTYNSRFETYQFKETNFRLATDVNIDLPAALVTEIRKCCTLDAVREVGIEWTIAQAKELIEHGVPALHFFTMGKSDNVRKVCETVF
jgi:5,10-methylenetetrahydrofolate reductase